MTTQYGGSFSLVTLRLLVHWDWVWCRSWYKRHVLWFDVRKCRVWCELCHEEKQPWWVQCFRYVWYECDGLNSWKDIVFLREWVIAIFRKHGSDHVDDDIKFGLINSGNIDENVASVQGNFTMFRVDDRRHWKDMIFGIVDNWVYRWISNDMQISREMFFGLANRFSLRKGWSIAKKDTFIPYLIDSHQFLCSICSILVQRNKSDVFGRFCFISKGWNQRIQIMCSNGNQLSPSTNILMQFILKINERSVWPWSKFDISEDSTCKERTNFRSLETVHIHIHIPGERVRCQKLKRTSGWRWIVNRFDSPPGGYTSLYRGAGALPRKVLRTLEMPSMQSKSYLIFDQSYFFLLQFLETAHLFAGVSIFSCYQWHEQCEMT